MIVQMGVTFIVKMPAVRVPRFGRGRWRAANAPGLIERQNCVVDLLPAAFGMERVFVRTFFLFFMLEQRRLTGEDRRDRIGDRCNKRVQKHATRCRF